MANEKDLFFKSGILIYKFPWPIIFLWVGIFILSLPALINLNQSFKTIGYFDRNSESAQAALDLKDKLGIGINRFVIVFHHDKWSVVNNQFTREVNDSLASLKNFPIPHKIIYPEFNSKQISSDKHTVYAVVLFEGGIEVNPEVLTQFKAALKAPVHLKMYLGGEPIFIDELKKQSQQDLFKAEFFSVPISIIAMLWVFGSVVAASLPVLMGLFCIDLIFCTLYLLGKTMILSVFALNIAILLGLCLSLDYSLLIVSRFRDELKAGHPVNKAIALTLATAGKSVFFSALAVFISLSALLIFPVNLLNTIGLSGMITVFCTAIITLLLLPAMLAAIGEKINALPLRFLHSKSSNSPAFGKKIITKIVHYPFTVFIVILILLLSLGTPFINAKLDVPNFNILPQQLETRKSFDTMTQAFGNSNLMTPIIVAITSQQKNILSRDNIYHIYQFAHSIQQDPRVSGVDSIVTIESHLNVFQYQYLYSMPIDYLDVYLKKAIDFTTRDNMTVLYVFSKYAFNSQETYDLIQKIRNSNPGNGLKLQVTGVALAKDTLHAIYSNFPYALALIIAVTYVILLCLFQSIILPIKAILMNLLSLTACFGVLVLVFQEGYLSNLLDFEPQHFLDVSMLIIIFCGVFGMSMDYEVFMLSRIKEAYEKSQDTVQSVISGTYNSSKIINNAALIVILVSLSFVYSASIVFVKAFGLGIAVAVFVDAFLIRTILVPATMCLLKNWNWYLPKWLSKILPAVKFNIRLDMNPPQ